jgi:GTP-binding protein Era
VTESKEISLPGETSIAKASRKPTFRAGYCAIVGVPNAGKSTLLNALLGTKLSIMSRKPQTTRKRVLGIYSSSEEQIVFLDTPGIMHKPSTLLHKAMLEEVRRSFSDADVILVLADSTQPFERALPNKWDEYVKIAGGKPIVLALSKTDTTRVKTDLIPMLEHYAKMEVFREIVPISSTKRYNLKELLKVLHQFLPGNTPFFDEDQLSDQNERFFVSELIREAIFQKYKEEVPYSTEVEIREFKEREAGKWYINADILVERDSQKGIIIGKAGESLKALGAHSRSEIERFLDQSVFLELHVKTKADWRNDKRRLTELGYSV